MVLMASLMGLASIIKSNKSFLDTEMKMDVYSEQMS
tara:strand:+ start:575 stop:682 length:108 start_codon:yes stop_codon:yes gene_type:complete